MCQWSINYSNYLHFMDLQEEQGQFGVSKVSLAIFLRNVAMA